MSIDKDDSEVADNLSIVFQDTAQRLAEFPEIGRICGDKIKVYKCLIIDYNVWVIYTFSNEDIDILRVLHTSKDFYNILNQN